MSIDITLACDAPLAVNLKDMNMFGSFFKFFDGFIPNLKDGCPYTGVFNLTDWEFDREAPKLLPPIVPEGIFLFHHRIHLANNHTIAEAKFVAESRPIGTAELIKLGK